MDNRKVFGYQDWAWRAESGDWRFYSADVPDSPALPSGARWLVHTSWDATPTDNDTLLYGPEARTTSSPSSPDSIFGPYDLGLKGGSARTLLGEGRWGFGTATGAANEWVSGPLASGLNEIMIHNTLYSGASIGSTFTGSAGVIASQPGTITVRSNASSGTVPVTFATSMNLPGLSTKVAGLSAITTYATATPAAGWWYGYVTVTDAPYIRFTSACPNADLDLVVWHWDADADDWVVAAVSDSSSGDEEIKLVNPTPGDYAVGVGGVPNTPFTATVDAPEGTNLALTGVPVGALSAGTACTMTAQWTRPGTPPYDENTTYSGVIYLGPPGAAQVVEIPVQFVADLTAAAPASLRATPGYRSATLSWADSSDCALTRVYRSTTRYASGPDDAVGQTKIMDSLGTAITDQSLTPGVRYYYTLFNRDTAGNWSVAAATNVVPQSYATLSKPSIKPSKPKHGKAFKVSGKISPKHPSKTTVKLCFYRKVGGTYRLYKSVNVTVAARAGSYSKSVSLSAKGSYYVKAYHADAAHAGRYSASRTFAVK
jgi:hypothetical protein